MEKGPLEYQPQYAAYYKMYHTILPPRQAYSFFPTEQNIRSKANPKNPERLIYYGMQQLEPQEHAKLEEFAKFKATLSPNDQALANQFSQKETFRFIAANKFRYSKAAEDMKKYLKWRADSYPMKLNDALANIIQSKFLMVIGRDFYFRPIIFFDVVILSKIIKDGAKVEDVGKVGIFMLEHVLHYMMLPGQVENWIGIIDVQKQGLSDLPLSALGEVIKVFTSCYKSRTAKIFIVNTTILTSALWTAVSAFIEKGTKVKIMLSSESYPQEMKDMIHPEQVFERLGGWLKEPAVAWPPNFENRHFMKDEGVLLKEEDYKKKLGECNRLIPPPDLAKQYAPSRDKTCSINKPFYFLDKIVTMSTYNEVSDVKSYP